MTEPAILGAALSACFTAVMFVVKQFAEWHRDWRQRRIERVSKLLDEYYWPMLLVLVELHDMQSLLEDASSECFHEKAASRKVELAGKLEEIMTTGVAMAQPRSIIVAPMLAVLQQLSYLRIGADVTKTLTLLHIEVLLALCRERLRQFQREYNQLTCSPSMSRRVGCRPASAKRAEDPNIVGAIRTTAERALERREPEAFGRLLAMFRMRECDSKTCRPDYDAEQSMSVSARAALSRQFVKAVRKSRVDNVV